MTKVGVVGLGNMGSGIAKNLLLHKFETIGFDLDNKRMASFVATGGKKAKSLVELAKNIDAVFVMVMSGDQAYSVILGEDGLLTNMPDGSSIILTATIQPSEAERIGLEMRGSGVNLIDTPVSGGFAGAQKGTLTMMAAGAEEAIRKNRTIMEAVSEKIHHVGKKPGQGQTIKACLQSLIGAQFAATFEAAVLAAKAGLNGEVLLNVFSSSGAGCSVVNNALEKIIDRQFEPKKKSCFRGSYLLIVKNFVYQSHIFSIVASIFNNMFLICPSCEAGSLNL